jgi:pyrroline-5-carboxylate reductase
MIDASLWMVGCGNMGGAMLSRWLESGIDPALITVIDPALPTIAAGIKVLAAPPHDVVAPAVVILGTKPQMFDRVATEIAPCLSINTIVISIMAGISVQRLSAQLITPHALIRAMPNMPVSLGRGLIALYGAEAGSGLQLRIDALMAPLGAREWLADEALFDAVTALSGSGPAFVYRFIDALARGGAALGLPVDQATRMAVATVAGAGALAQYSSGDPATLAKRVTSPGGTTERGLAVLDERDALATLVAATLAATAERSAELGQTRLNPSVGAP